MVDVDINNLGVLWHEQFIGVLWLHIGSELIIILIFKRNSLKVLVK